MFAFFSNASLSPPTNIAIFPELVITGYPPQDLLCEKLFVEESIKILRQCFKALRDGDVHAALPKKVRTKK